MSVDDILSDDTSAIDAFILRKFQEADIDLAEEIGALAAGALMWLAGGLLGCLYAGLIRRRLGRLFRLPPAYLLVCGGCFVLYMVFSPF